MAYTWTMRLLLSQLGLSAIACVTLTACGYQVLPVELPLQTQSHMFDHLPPCEARVEGGAASGDLAVLRTDRIARSTQIRLLDGRRYVTPYGWYAALSCNPEVTQIEPGPHSIQVSWLSTRHGALRAATFNFIAEPGHSYAIIYWAAGDISRRLIDETSARLFERPVEAMHAENSYPYLYEVMDEVWAAYVSCGDEYAAERMSLHGRNPDLGACRDAWFEATRAPASLIRMGFLSPDFCRHPYQLSQDCESRGRPERGIMIDGIEMRIAGSSDGSTVLLAGGQRRGGRIASGESYVNIRSSAIYAFGLVKRELARDGIDIVKVIAYGDGFNTLEIIVVTDGDAYSRLRRYSLRREN